MNFRKLLLKTIENWPAKVLCAGLAIMLFVFHSMSALEERFFSVPLVVERGGFLVPSSPYPRIIRVNLRGEASSIFSIMESDIEVFVNIDGFNQPGIYTVPVQWRQTGLNHNEPVQITVEPMEITLSLDHRLSRAVPLSATLRGQVETGHTLTSYFLNPDQVVIDGPAGLISGISEIFTEPIELGGQRNDFSLSALILNPDPLILVRGSGLSEFHANVTQIITVRNIPNVPIYITGLMDELYGQLQLAAANIRLEGGSQEALDAFTPPPGFLRVDGSGIDQPGTYILRVIAAYAENVIIRVEPEEVIIQVNLIEEPYYEDEYL